MIFAAAIIAFSSSVAFADDIMASRYGNTTISTDPSGAQTKIYYNADGTFTGKQGDAGFSGTWKIDGDKICLSFSPQVPGQPNPLCTPAAAHKVGDTWGAGPRTVTLVQGIQ
jgi:hypothetical protein